VEHIHHHRRRHRRRRRRYTSGAQLAAKLSPPPPSSSPRRVPRVRGNGSRAFETYYTNLERLRARLWSG